jgi:NADH-quinone oxidoreductase subunit J
MSSAKLFYISNLVFFITLFLMLVTLYFVVSSRNPIKVILFLIAFFFEVAFLFIYCGADYLGVLILMLYAGAISIILLFVIMLLDMKDLLLRRERFSTPVNLLLLFYFFFILKEAAYRVYLGFNMFFPRNQYINWFSVFQHRTNIEVIGTSLYEFYLFQFIMIGVGLFIVMLLIISLIINYNLLTKKQVLEHQLYPTSNLKFYE